MTELEPITFKAPDGPFVGALGLTLRDARGPADRGELRQPGRQGPRSRRPASSARRRRSDAVRPVRPRRLRPPALVGAGRPTRRARSTGQGKGSSSTGSRCPRRSSRPGPSRSPPVRGRPRRPGREKVDWPERPNPQDYPQTDARKWPSTLELAVNGQAVAPRRRWPTTRPTPAACSRTWPGSSTAATASSSSSAGRCPTSVRADLAAGKPLVAPPGRPRRRRARRRPLRSSAPRRGRTRSTRPS